TKHEQKRRFEERDHDPYKRWKIGPEDWRNREHWDQYVDAAEDMFDVTNSAVAPWKIIGGDRKWHARLEVMRHVRERLEAAAPDDD
ncbi:MAG TPA: hypothetical protein VHB97_06770, partial [Polyangia bacterium]|nr:hypothetical protein [Polyangia bacterium]